MLQLLPFLSSRRKQHVCLGTRGLFGLSALRLPLAHLRTHFYLVGTSGSGKSKLLQHLLFQLAAAGWGGGVIDPHSDLVSDLIAQLASHPKRQPWLANPVNQRRVIYLDPARSDTVVPVNLLRSSFATPYAIAENIVESFKRVWPDTLSEAPRFAQILRNALLVLATRGQTLLELEPFLTDGTYRAKLLTNFPDRQVTSFFDTQYNRWGREQVLMASPVLNKVSAFLFQPAVRLSLGATENRLDFRAIMDGRQLLLVDLGGLSGETQQLYGSLLVTSLEQAALSRRNQRVEERQPFFCLIDEFPFFCARDATSLARILSEVRKFNVFLGLAHQTIAQLAEGRLQGALENAKLKIIFGTGRQTATAVAKELFVANPQAIKHEVADETAKERTHPVYDPILEQLEVFTQTVQRLRRRHVLVKLPEEERVIELTTPTVPPSRLSNIQLEQIKQRLAKQVGRPQHEIAQAIALRQQQAPRSTQKDTAEEGADGWQEALWRQE